MTPLYAWVGFVVFVLLMLLLDLGVFHRKSHTVGFKESIIWSGIWIGFALIFSGLLYVWRGEQDSMLFLTGYVIEKSLSVDNLFVFLLIFSYFKIPSQYQHKLLFYGILGALIMRAVFIWAGIAILENFSWVIYIFGGILIVSGYKMMTSNADDHDLEKSWIIKVSKKFFPISSEIKGHDFFTRINGVLHVTPFFMALIFIEVSDVVFAVDSIPAIIGITNDPFLVFTSNVFAILGLRSLYFALSGFADMFHYLKYGLALILVFIGSKMLVSGIYHMPVAVTMIVIFGILFISVMTSIFLKKK